MKILWACIYISYQLIHGYFLQWWEQGDILQKQLLKLLKNCQELSVEQRDENLSFPPFFGLVFQTQDFCDKTTETDKGKRVLGRGIATRVFP